jgi:spoIIIJ-associated protein
MRGEARVRARVRPTQPRAKTERRDRKRKSTGPDAEAATTEAPQAADDAGTDDTGEAAEEGAEAPAPKPRSRAKPRAAAEVSSTGRAKASTTRVTEPVESDEADDDARNAEREAAVAFLQGLANALGETEAVAELVVLGEDEAEVRLDGGDLGLFIGPRGQTLIAVQDLTRLAAQKRSSDRRGRLRIDIGGYRERRREALARFTAQVADEVRASGAPRALEPMTSMDRKIVHDAANELEGVDTISEGEEPFRRVVIRPTVSA